MDFKELKKLSQAELQGKLTDLRQKVREFRFSVVNNQLKNLREIRQAKLEIARIMTVLNQNKDKANLPPAKVSDSK